MGTENIKCRILKGKVKVKVKVKVKEGMKVDEERK